MSEKRIPPECIPPDNILKLTSDNIIEHLEGIALIFAEQEEAARERPRGPDMPEWFYSMADKVSAGIPLTEAEKLRATMRMDNRDIRLPGETAMTRDERIVMSQKIVALERKET